MVSMQIMYMVVRGGIFNDRNTAAKKIYIYVWYPKFS